MSSVIGNITIIKGYKLILTSSFCPEQYDVFRNMKHLINANIGYLRLRHGYFSAEAINGDDYIEVYSAETKGDGVFDDDEREAHLTNAIEAIDNYFNIAIDMAHT